MINQFLVSEAAKLVNANKYDMSAEFNVAVITDEGHFLPGICINHANAGAVESMTNGAYNAESGMFEGLMGSRVSVESGSVFVNTCPDHVILIRKEHLGNFKCLRLDVSELKNEMLEMVRNVLKDKNVHNFNDFFCEICEQAGMKQAEFDEAFDALL